MKYGTLMYLVSKKGNLLMIKKGIRNNDPNSGYFAIPGGKLEDYEKGLSNSQGRLECAVRETIDETGIIPLNPVFRGIILFDNKERIFKDWKNPEDFLVYIYTSEEYKGEPKRSDEGIPYTIPLSKVGKLPTNAGDKIMYKWLKDGRNFFGVIKHKGEELDENGTWVDFY